MKTEQLSGLDKDLYMFLNSRINTYIEHIEIVFKEFELTEIQSSIDRLIEWHLIYVVKEIDDKPLYSTESKRHLQTPYP